MSTSDPFERRITRCAIYTRKSTERGLDMAVNWLETQREVCRAYIKCNEHRDWVESPQRYDDGGYTGGNLERPALQRLMGDIEAGRVDLIVVYKIDRLTRSLADSVRLIDVLDRFHASFVSVTQTFDTSDCTAPRSRSVRAAAASPSRCARTLHCNILKNAPHSGREIPARQRPPPPRCNGGATGAYVRFRPIADIGSNYCEAAPNPRRTSSRAASAPAARIRSDNGVPLTARAS